MKLFCVHTPAHEILLREHFAPSLPGSFKLVEQSLPIAGMGDFLSREFLECIARKLDLIVESIRAHPGELIVWADIDIIFFGDPVPELEQLGVDSPDCDLWFQREGPDTDEVNTGFILIRCTEDAAGFFSEAKRRMLAEPGKNEQAVENEMLQTGAGVGWDRLPRHYVARTHGWPPSREMVIYHANFSSGPDGVGQKIRQFAEVRRIMRWGAPAAAWAAAKRGLAKLAGR